MKHIIIGTAGHIDHGKTTLIKALTGRNTDRWEEEQRRGITIDLGFTYFDLTNGDRVGIIDVPGHERFINNMVAGVVGMDLVMLVIAADEGVMPQTREHMDILGQLGIEKSIIVLNKCDLVEPDWLELVKEEVAEELSGTFLEGAPVACVSAATGEGIPELITLIETLTEKEVAEKDTQTIPRLPIDRVFSLAGFGTIVTGTLLAGTISKEDNLQIYPIGKECKIRSIQVHGEDVDRCFAGQRVAINLSNVKKSELQRGCVLAPVNNMKNTTLLDVKLNMVKSSKRVLKNQSRLHLFTGTSEVLCRAVLLDKEDLGPGESGYAQLRLEEEIALRRGDKFVVRFYSPTETIGGGVILEPNPKKKKRFLTEDIEELKRKESGSTEDVLEMHIRAHGETMITVAELAKVTALTVEEVQSGVEVLVEQNIVRVFPMKKDVYVWHEFHAKQMEEAFLLALREYHQKYPYQHGIKKAQMHVTYMKQVKQNVFDAFLDTLEQEEKIARYQEYVSLNGFEVSRDKSYESVKNITVKALGQAGFDFVRFSELSFKEISEEVVEDILLLLLEEEVVVKVAEDMYTLKSLMEQAKELIEQKLRENPLITIAEVRDLLGTSRKSAKPILEYMDSIKVTKKNGTESERVAFR